MRIGVHTYTYTCVHTHLPTYLPTRTPTPYRHTQTHTGKYTNRQTHTCTRCASASLIFCANGPCSCCCASAADASPRDTCGPTQRQKQEASDNSRCSCQCLSDTRSSWHASVQARRGSLADAGFLKKSSRLQEWRSVHCSHSTAAKHQVKRGECLAECCPPLQIRPLIGSWL